jgi:hypothetical protein
MVNAYISKTECDTLTVRLLEERGCECYVHSEIDTFKKCYDQIYIVPIANNVY